MSKVLFIDIPGILNTWKSPYQNAEFDGDKVARLKEIVEETGCRVVLTPLLPSDKRLVGCAMREGHCIESLMRALCPEWDVGLATEAAIAVAMFANKDDQITGFAVVRANDTPELEWQLTFPTRYIKIDKSEGLTEEKKDAIIRTLNTDVVSDEVPLKVVTASEVEGMVREMFGRGVISGSGERLFLSEASAEEGGEKEDVSEDATEAQVMKMEEEMSQLGKKPFDREKTRLKIKYLKQVGSLEKHKNSMEKGLEEIKSQLEKEEGVTA